MTDVMALKASLRLEIKNRLKEVCQADILQQAQAIAPHIHSLPEFQRANGVSVFLSMKGEVDTYGIIKGLLEDHNKQVFIPKIVGKAAKDMVMVPLRSYAEIDQYPRNKWGIPEPAAPGDGHSSEAHFQGIDLVLMPGVGFDRTGGRLGHGKGYYDCFVERLTNVRRAAGKPDPCLVGLSLSQQLLDNVPMETHDRPLNYLVTSNGVMHRHVK